MASAILKKKRIPQADVTAYNGNAVHVAGRLQGGQVDQVVIAYTVHGKVTLVVPADHKALPRLQLHGIHIACGGVLAVFEGYNKSL